MSSAEWERWFEVSGFRCQICSVERMGDSRQAVLRMLKTQSRKEKFEICTL